MFSLKKIKNGEMFNMNNKSKGEHIIAIIKNNNILYEYDTYTRPVKSLSKYWKNINIVSANKDVGQPIREENCGSRYMAWLISFDKNKEKAIRII